MGSTKPQQVTLNLTSAQSECISPIIKVGLLGNQISALVDSGASINVMSRDVFNKIGKCLEVRQCNLEVKGISETIVYIKEKVIVDIEIDGEKFHAELFIVDKLSSKKYSVLLGSNFLSEHGLILNYKERFLAGKNILVQWGATQFSASVNNVKVVEEGKYAQEKGVFGYLSRKLVLDPRTEAVVQVKARGVVPTVTENVLILPANDHPGDCLLYTSPSPRDKRQSRMPSSA